MTQSDERLLLVDDNQDNLYVLEQVLQSNFPNATLLTATSGPDGLALARAHTPNGILCDMQMPSMDGITFCRHLNDDPKTTNIPVLLITAHQASARLRAEGLDAGADDFIVRPVDNLELCARIRTMLRIQDAELKLRQTNSRLEDLVLERTEKILEYKKAVEASRDLIATIDEKYRFLMANQAFIEFHSLQGTPIIGQSIKDLLPESHVRDNLLPWIDRALAGEAISLETWFQPRAREPRCLQITFHPLEGGGVVGAGRDITEQRLAEQAVGEKEAFLQNVIDGASDPIMVVTQDYRVVLMNRAARTFLPQRLNHPEEQMTCHYLYHRRNEPCCDRYRQCPLTEVLATGEPITLTHEHTLKSGEIRIYELVASPFFNKEMEIDGIIHASRDITDRLEAEAKLFEHKEHLQHLVHYDSLTDLPNRLLFQDRLRQAIAKSSGTDQSFALLFLDLDQFKKINDSLGHESGDHLLCDVAQRLKKCLRPSDTLARWGGDEFLFLLEDIDDLQHIARLAGTILQCLSPPIELPSGPVYITASIGITLFPEDANDYEGLMRCADTAMYQSKAEGPNRFQFYTPDMNERAQDLLALEGGMRMALEREEFTIYYQPQILQPGGEVIGLEALLRWNHPERGLVSPAEFIPLAENNGLIIPLGQWVLTTAARQVQHWRQTVAPDLRLAVNISPLEFKQSDLIYRIKDALAESGLAPEALELEITEGLIMNNIEAAIHTMNDLNALGVRLAIDDFGTGYSSLAYLKRFPISTLKIDRSFVQDVTCNANDAAIASSIIALAQTMNLQVLAEGVETEDQLIFLEDKGCQLIQGFLFSRPLPPDEVERLLKPKQAGTRAGTVRKGSRKAG